MTAGSRRSAKREPAVFVDKMSRGSSTQLRRSTRQYCVYITYSGMHYRAAINDKRRPDGNIRQYSILHGHWEN